MGENLKLNNINLVLCDTLMREKIILCQKNEKFSCVGDSSDIKYIDKVINVSNEIGKGELSGMMFGIKKRNF